MGFYVLNFLSTMETTFYGVLRVKLSFHSGTIFYGVLRVKLTFYNGNNLLEFHVLSFLQWKQSSMGFCTLNFLSTMERIFCGALHVKLSFYNGNNLLWSFGVKLSFYNENNLQWGFPC